MGSAPFGPVVTQLKLSPVLQSSRRENVSVTTITSLLASYTPSKYELPLPLLIRWVGPPTGAFGMRWNKGP